MSLEDYKKNNLSKSETMEEESTEKPRNLEGELSNELGEEELTEEELGEEELEGELGEEELEGELGENEMGEEPSEEEMENELTNTSSEGSENKDKIFSLTNQKPNEELGDAVNKLNKANQKKNNQTGGSNKTSKSIVQSLKNKKSKKRKPVDRDTELRRKMAIRSYYAKKNANKNKK